VNESDLEVHDRLDEMYAEADHPFRGMSRPPDSSIVVRMSLLSQLAPREPDTLTSIDISTSASIGLPDVPIGPQVLDRIDHSGTLEAAEELTLLLLCSRDVGDDGIARLEAGVDEYVDVWTPALHTTSRFELVSVFAGLDDSIGDLVVTFSEAVESGPTVFLSWRASGRFVRPAFLDDDHLLEPTGAVIRLAGAISLAFTAGRRAERIRCYYDRLALVTQMLAPGAAVAKGY
jgi:hypothetical protein